MYKKFAITALVVPNTIGVSLHGHHSSLHLTEEQLQLAQVKYDAEKRLQLAQV